MSFEAYKVSVRLSLINGVSAGLLGMVRQFQGLDKDVAGINRRLTETELVMARIKKQTLIGGALLGTGAFGLGLIERLVKPASEYAHQLNIMNMAGLKQQDIVQAVGAAWKNTGSVITTTATENLRSLMDLRNILGDMGEAKMALPVVSRIQAVLAASSEGQIAGNSKDLAYSMAKALDIIGAAQNPQQFEHQAELMAKVIVATQGRVTPESFKSVFQYARQAKYQLSDEFKYELLPSLIQENSTTGGSGGGSRGVGPMLAAFYRWANQGYINKKALPELHNLGLVNANTALQTTTQGTTVGAMKRSDLAAANPFQWVQEVLVPAIKHKYGENLTKDQLLTHINEITRGNQLAGALLGEFAFKPINFYRDQSLIRGTMSTEDAYKAAYSNDPNTAEKALHAQWENFKTALGVNIVPIVVPALIKLSEGLNKLGMWAREHPDLTRDLVIGFTILAGAMAFSGTVVLLSAGFKALGVVLQMTAFTTTAATLPGLLGGIGTAIMTLGRAATVFGALWAGYEIGEGINYLWDKYAKGYRDPKDTVASHLTPYARTRLRDPSVQNRLDVVPHAPLVSDKSVMDFFNKPVTQPVTIHLHNYLDGKDIGTQILGPENMTGPQGLNPLVSRPMPGTPGMGY